MSDSLGRGGGESQALWVQGQPCVQSKFQDNQDYIGKPCLKRKKGRKGGGEGRGGEGRVFRIQSIKYHIFKMKNREEQVDELNNISIF